MHKHVLIGLLLQLKKCIFGEFNEAIHIKSRKNLNCIVSYSKEM